MVTDRDMRLLQDQIDEQVVRLDSIVSRLGQSENVAAHHGEEHNDFGSDPIFGRTLAGHTHPTATATTPVVAATASTTLTASQSHILVLPGSISSGNLLIVAMLVNAGGENVITWSTADTWTQLFTRTIGVTKDVFEVRYRQADGGEGASITNTTTLSGTCASIGYRITGHKDPAIQPPEVESAKEVDPPQLDATGDETAFLWLAMCAMSAASADVTAAPTDYAPLITSSGTANDADIGGAVRALNVSPENPDAFTATPDNKLAACCTIVIHPA